MIALIVGGSGGIGQALASTLISMGYDVHATYHRTAPPNSTPVGAKGIQWHQCDVTNEAQIEKLASQFPSVDILINTVGILHTSEQKPEKSITQLDPDAFLNSMAHNALPTLLLAKHFRRQLNAKHKTLLISFSARVGSISDNRRGGWYSYRCSKAALNMAIKTIAIEWQTKLPQCCVVAFHPGTIDTALSEPFQKHLPEGQLKSPQWVADKLCGLISQWDQHASGHCYDYNGTVIPW
ncbi:SDR family NAD(P)-dependent oxidoreductase [Vibrio sp. WXL210]|uniref:SDR family NAD(P)-dependent oxidoreductase n=1 Tax=Vibrio sp. WXL210 TaxID=3450709 RepID=UPI003EC6FBCC